MACNKSKRKRFMEASRSSRTAIKQQSRVSPARRKETRAQLLRGKREKEMGARLCAGRNEGCWREHENTISLAATSFSFWSHFPSTNSETPAKRETRKRGGKQEVEGNEFSLQGTRRVKMVERCLKNTKRGGTHPGSPSSNHSIHNTQ